MNDRVPIRPLIVEDNPTDALLLREALRDVLGAEFAITHVETLAHALARLAKQEFDVVLLDLGLPDSQGPDTLIRLHRHQPDVPVVVFTGLDDEAVGIRAMQLGAQDYLVKGHFQSPLLGRSLRYAMERHHSALALRKSEARLSGLIASAMDAIITVDDQQRIVLFNPAAEQAFGCKASEALGQTLDRFIPERFRSAHADHQGLFGYTNFTRKRMGETELICGLRADGTEFPMEASMSQVEVVGQKLLTVILRDITDRQRAEAERTRLITAIEQCAESILITDLNGTIQYANPMFSKVSGYSREEAVGQNPRLLKSGEHDRSFWEGFWNTILAGKHWHGEVINRRKDGSLYTDELHVAPVRDTQGKIAHFISNQLEVTERKRAEAALHLRTQALEAAANGIVITDREGTIAWTNAAVATLSGYTFDELVGKNARVFKSGRHNEAFYRDLWTTICSGQVWRGELVNRRKDGSFYTEEMTITPVRDHTGEIARFIAIKQDVTERRKAQEEIRKLNEELDQRVKARTAELEAANKEMEAFTYSVSHDLRAPLRYINGFSDILLEDYVSSLDGNGRANLERIKAAATNMGHLVDGLLKLSRLGRQALKRRLTALNPLVDAVVEEIRPDLKDREIEWRIGRLPAVECDPELVRRVLVNLLSNAVKYTRPRQHGVIVVDHTMAGGRPVFFVRDNGVGFNMKYADKLFGVFQRLHRAEEFEGTGVGLATVQRIIHKHGGNVWAEAELDKGATFYFTLGSAAERRREERWTVERPVTLKAELNLRSTYRDAVTVNVSARGARVHGDIGLSLGQSIDLITKDGPPQAVPAEVVWVNQSESGRGEAGVKFLEPTDLPFVLLSEHSVALSHHSSTP